MLSDLLIEAPHAQGDLAIVLRLVAWNVRKWMNGAAATVIIDEVLHGRGYHGGVDVGVAVNGDPRRRNHPT